MINIADKSECSGCGACKNICSKQCIKMLEDVEGFLYPRVDENKCNQCGLCEKVCPVSNGKITKLKSYPKVLLAWNINKKFRDEATSGGVFTGVAEIVLRNGGIVFGVSYDENNAVKHIEIRKIEDISRINRSKYVQSQTGDTFQSVDLYLQEGVVVLYSGTACQIYGLLSYLKCRNTSIENLITMDVICHGTPSPKLLKEYIKWQENSNNANISSIRMREKKYPRPFYSISTMKVIFNNGKKSEIESGIDYYGRFFWGEISSRPSCHKCVFKTIGRISDITIGDCWFSRALTGQKDIPYDVTLCLVHSKKGLTIIDEQKDILNTIAVDSEKAIKCNGGMIYKSTIAHKNRKEFFELLGKLPLDEIAEKYFPIKLNKNYGLLFKAKHILKRLPFIYEIYYFKNKKKEFILRCERQIPTDSFVKRELL